MGKGIAVEFKKRWGKPLCPVSFNNIDTTNSSISISNEFSVGDIGIIKDGDRK